MLKKQVFLLMLPCLLTLFGTWSYADITAVVDRTAIVRDVIVAAISDVDTAADVTEAHLATISALDLRNQGITELIYSSRLPLIINIMKKSNEYKFNVSSVSILFNNIDVMHAICF